MTEMTPIIMIPQYKKGKLKKIEKRELVQCKDCKYHDEEDGKNFCDCGNRPDDWFCADGIRKDGK